MRYSQGWHLIINTGTSVVTFLMVFLIERSQSKDARAIQLKQELEVLQRRFREVAERAHREMDTGSPRSVDDTPER